MERESQPNGLTREDTILINEHQEGARECRHLTQLIRTGLQIFGAIQVAIIGVLSSGKIGAKPASFALLIFGIGLSLVTLHTSIRLSKRYESYMKRIHDIESKLGMDLFNYSQGYFTKEGLDKGVGNQQALSLIPALALLIYLVYPFFI
jgi:hypothetical protein